MSGGCPRRNWDCLLSYEFRRVVMPTLLHDLNSEKSFLLSLRDKDCDPSDISDEVTDIFIRKIEKFDDC